MSSECIRVKTFRYKYLLGLKGLNVIFVDIHQYALVQSMFSDVHHDGRAEMC